MKRSTLAALAATTSLALTACAAPTTSSEGGDSPVLDVVALLDLSGVQAVAGNQQKQAIEMALEQIEKASDLEVNLTIEDAQSSSDKSVELTRTAVNNGADAILGPIPQGSCQGLRTVTEPANVLAYCYSGGPFEWSSTFFAGAFNPKVALGGLPVQFFESRGWEKIGCLASADASGEAYSVPLEEAAEEAGIDVEIVTYQAGAEDVVPQLSKLKSSDVDAVYSCASGNSIVAAARGVVQLGWDVPVFAGAGSVQTEMAEGVRDYMPKGGLYSVGNWVAIPDEMPADHPRRDAVQEWVDNFTSISGEGPSEQAGNAADSLALVAEAAEELNASGQDIDGESLSQALEQLTGYDGLISSYTFSPDEHRGTKQEPIILQWTDEGTFKLEELLSEG